MCTYSDFFFHRFKKKVKLKVKEIEKESALAIFHLSIMTMSPLSISGTNRLTGEHYLSSIPCL